jgi:Domain of unknown function (DUF4349)
MSALDLEAILRGEEGSTAEEQRLAEVVALVRAAPPVAPAQLRARVVRATPVPARPRFAFHAPRRALLVVVAAAVGLAVLAAIVHGLVGSSSTTTTPAERKAAVREAVPAPAWQSSTVQHGAGAAGGSAFVPSTQRVLGRPGAPTLSGGARLQHVDASLRVRVANVDKLSQATTKATRVARSLGGYALSVQYRTPAGRVGQAFLELRIPTAKVQRALAELAGLGTLISQRLSVQDLQRDLDRENAQILQLREAVAAYQAALRDPSITPVQRVELQLKLAEAKRALAQRTHARKGTLAEGALSRISLVLTTAKPAHAATHHEGRLGRGLDGAISFLGLEGIIVLYALIVVSPFLLVGGLAWAAARARRRRDEARLLAT